MNINLYLIPYTKINLKWITDLHVTAKTIKSVEENIEENLCDKGVDKDFGVDKDLTTHES